MQQKNLLTKFFNEIIMVFLGKTMKPLKPNEVSYIIEAQIRGISVDQVLGKTPIVEKVEELPAKKAPAKKRVAKPKEPKVTPDSNE